MQWRRKIFIEHKFPTALKSDKRVNENSRRRGSFNDRENHQNKPNVGTMARSTMFKVDCHKEKSVVFPSQA